MRRVGRVVRRLCERASLGVQSVSSVDVEVQRGCCGRAPLDLCADDIDNLIGQAGNALVAEVDGDAGLLRLQVAGGRGCLCSAVVDVVAGLFEGGLCEGHDLVVGDGRGHVVAHGDWRGGSRGGGSMLVAALLVDVLVGPGRGRGPGPVVVHVGLLADLGRLAALGKEAGTRHTSIIAAWQPPAAICRPSSSSIVP